MRTLGKDAIIEEMKNGARLYRVNGKFGGWGIENTSKICAVRKDSCYKLLASGTLKVVERSTNSVTYELK